jgi:SET domain
MKAISLVLYFGAHWYTLASLDSVEECGLYLAVSSTSTVDETKWGIFAGKDIPPNTPIGYPDVGINVLNLRSNAFYVSDDEATLDYMDQIATFFETFFWVADTIGAKFEQTSGRAVAAIPGAGVLGGYNGKLTNADWNISGVYNRPVIGENSGESHPGRGANSHFYNTQVISKQHISAGSEIFMDFGESWAEQETDEDGFDDDDYEKIDATVEQLITFFEKHNESLDEDSKIEIYSFVTKDVLKAAVGAAKARRISQLLPPHPDDLYKVPEAGGALVFKNPSVYRTVEWLNEFGLCVDSIRPGASTIPNAGRGAFATKAIKKGAMVAPVPLTHFPDKRILNMYDLSPNENGELVKHSDEAVGRQLLENYCYSHPQSSMLFFPSGTVVPFINHHDEPNAKMVWSSHPNHQRLWLELAPQQLADEEHLSIGLLMELVATRDIEPGDEIFIDYGPQWKEAWENHLNEWNLRIQRGEIPQEWPLKAIDINARYSSKPFETEAELVESYPGNTMLKAFLMLQDTDNEGTLEDPKLWDSAEDSGAFHHDNLFSVIVVERVKLKDSKDAMPYIYTLRWDSSKSESTYISGVPHRALTFVDKAGTSDQFFKSFRHYIGIPDEIFPSGPWRNLS